MILLMFFYIFNVDVLACVCNRKPKLIWEDEIWDVWDVWDV